MLPSAVSGDTYITLTINENTTDIASVVATGGAFNNVSVPTTTTLTSTANPSSYGQSVTFNATVSSAYGTPTDTVTFKDGATTLGSSALSSGTASYSTSALTGGGHTITAEYSGNGTYTASTSSELSQTVNPIDQTTPLTASASPTSIVYGQTSTLSTSGGTGTGAVTWEVTAGSSYCSVVGTTLTGIGAGTCTVTATKAADSNYNSSSDTVDVTVSADSTTTALVASPSSSTYGSPVTFTATVTADHGQTVNGSVSFYDGATLLGSSALSGGTAILSTSSLTGGSHSISAVYAGNSNFITSISTTLSFSVTAVDQVTELTATATPSGIAYGGTATLSTSGGSGTGAVTWAVTTGGSYCSVVGTTLTGIGAGTCTVTATKAADSNYNAATATTDVVVSQAVQTITFTSPGSQVMGSPPFDLTATASSELTVSFASNSVSVCTVSGNTVTLVSVGTCSITATQAGDSNYGAADPVTVTFAVTGTPEVGLTVSASPDKLSELGQTITFTYSVYNPCGVTVTNLTITDTRVSGITCPSTSIAGGATATCTGRTTVTKADILAQNVTSSATAQVSYNSNPLTSDTVTTTVGVDVAEVQEQTKTAIQSFQKHRVSVLASTGGPSMARTHGRFGGGAFPGGGGASGPAFGMGERNRDIDTTAALRPSILSGLEAEDETGMLPSEMAEHRRRAVLPFGFHGSAGDGNQNFSFSASLSQMRTAQAAELADKEAAARASGGDGIMRLGNGPDGLAASALSQPLPFDIWIEGVWTGYNADDGTTKRNGRTGVFSVGFDYLISPDLLVGAYLQFDTLSERSKGANAAHATGNGWMAGPYLSARLSPSLFFDTRFAWGQSCNVIDPLGTYLDQYDTTRWLVSAKLTGNWNSNGWQFLPSVEISYFEEAQLAYANALGIEIGEGSSSLGRLAFGPQLSRLFTLDNGVMIEPFAGLQGVWDFDTGEQSSGSGSPFSDGSLRARAELGSSIRNKRGLTLRASGSFDGIGDTHFNSTEGRASLLIPLN